MVYWVNLRIWFYLWFLQFTNTVVRPGLHFTFPQKTASGGRQAYIKFLLSLLIRPPTVSDFCPLLSPRFPLPCLSGTARRDNAGEGGRGQRWKQTGAWSHLRDELPLGRLFSRVRHPGAAGACEWRGPGNGALQWGDLSGGVSSPDPELSQVS